MIFVNMILVDFLSKMYHLHMTSCNDGSLHYLIGVITTSHIFEPQHEISINVVCATSLRIRAD